MQSPPTSEFAFHQAIVSVIEALKDPHTVYVKPSCFAAFALQPFMLTGSINPKTGAQRIEIDGLLSLLAGNDAYNGIDLAGLVGAELATIDGSDAVATIIEFARVHGYISKGAAYLPAGHYTQLMIM